MKLYSTLYLEMIQKHYSRGVYHDLGILIATIRVSWKSQA